MISRFRILGRENEITKRIGILYFSPTNTTKEICKAIAFGMGAKDQNYTSIQPVFKSEKCIHCGICSKRCPINIISPETGNWLNQEAKKQCIGCMACVSSCKDKARFVGANLGVRLMLRYVLRKAAVQLLEPLTIFN